MSRLQNLLICSTLSLVAQLAQGQNTFPYVAYIAAPQTFARSGPGQQHYPTLQLSQGHAVEIYRHDSDGWCAVRPPEGSFCLIPAHEIHRISSEQAEVAVQTTLARVGSSISPARSAVQVMLRRGEEVQLLPAGPNDDPRWLRIAPPAGEFRWVAANSLSRTPPVEGSQGVQFAGGWTRQRFNGEIRPVAGEADEAFAHLLQTAPVAPPLFQGTLSTPMVSTPTPLNTAPDAVQIVANSPADQKKVPGTFLPIDPRSSTTPRVRFGNSPAVVGPSSELIQELQLRLSEIIVQPKEEWQFQQLQAEATALLEKSDSVSERDQIRNLLDRITKFQQIQTGRSSETLTAQAGSVKNGGDFTGMTSKVRDLAENDLRKEDPFEGQTPNPGGPRYDAVGRLKPVVSSTDGAPRYALVDDKGAVVSFVTPNPDLNLQPYLGMRIGVNGPRGFMPEYRKAHVTAGRATPIEDRIRR